MVSVLDLQERTPEIEEHLEAPQGILSSSSGGGKSRACCLALATIILMICVAISYLAGKSMSWRKLTAPPVVVVRGPDPPPIVLNQEPVPVVEAPVFADPKNGSVYIQMGAMEKGVSIALRRRFCVEQLRLQRFCRSRAEREDLPGVDRSPSPTRLRIRRRRTRLRRSACRRSRAGSQIKPAIQEMWGGL